MEQSDIVYHEAFRRFGKTKQLVDAMTAEITRRRAILAAIRRLRAPPLCA